MFQAHCGLKRELKVRKIVMIITSKYPCFRMIKARKCCNASENITTKRIFLCNSRFFNQKLEFCDNACFMLLNGGNIADTTLNSIKPVNHVLCYHPHSVDFLRY